MGIWRPVRQQINLLIVSAQPWHLLLTHSFMHNHKLNQAGFTWEESCRKCTATAAAGCVLLLQRLAFLIKIKWSVLNTIKGPAQCLPFPVPWDCHNMSQGAVLQVTRTWLDDSPDADVHKSINNYFYRKKRSIYPKKKQKKNCRSHVENCSVLQWVVFPSTSIRAAADIYLWTRGNHFTVHPTLIKPF